jgi:tetratricopeptide (TPR) repeat protein
VAIAKRIGDDDILSWGLEGIGNSFFLHSDYAQAYAYYQKEGTYIHDNNHITRFTSFYNRLGAAKAALGEWGEAEIHFQDALSLWQRLEPQIRSAPTLSGLAEIELSRLNTDKAIIYIYQILAMLDSGLSMFIDQIPFPFHIYRTCLKVLLTNQDPRLDVLLEEVHSLLVRQANKIEDARQKETYLNIPWHREIIQMWENR